MSLQTIIRDRGLKQSWIARKIGMDDSTLSTAVRGRSAFPSDKIEPFAKVLGVSVETVLRAMKTMRNGK